MLACIVTGLVFTFRNQELITVDLLFHQTASFSVGIWILAALIFGVVLGWVLSYPRKIVHALKIKQLSKKASESNRISTSQVKNESNKGR